MPLVTTLLKKNTVSHRPDVIASPVGFKRHHHPLLRENMGGARVKKQTLSCDLTASRLRAVRNANGRQYSP